MTNLSQEQPSWRRKLTRERVLVGVPLVVGGMVACSLAFTVVSPRLVRVEAQKQRLEQLLNQEASLPLLPGKLKTATEQLAKVQQQQDVLLNLVAGKNKIQTFLAQLSREAMAAGVLLELYQPVLPAPSPSAAASQEPPGTKSNPDSEEISPESPLAGRVYEKTAVLLQARGPFISMQGFLRGIEALQLVVQPSELELTALDPKQGPEEDVLTGPAITQLKLKLTFYDKASVPAKQGERRILDSEEEFPPEA
ncbi:hypothetical protein [Prochlorococcus sp. MIT 1201]|uniref:hypothetical protein n=1 Tax=Prochlorococcus sp. MIT 1201 TaxID=3082535 RepID=UPI0039A45E66